MRALISLAALALTGAAPPVPQVSESRLRADVEAMVAFGTRHTLSSQDDPKRGIGAALRWGEGQFRAISRQCGDCLTIALPEATVTGARIPVPTRLVNVVAIQRGSERPNEVVIVQGHIDSRVSNEMDAASDAPGANDNASGSALVIEAARVLSRRRYPGTVVYALLSGEEQGLHGGKLLADWAKAQGWTVKAVLNNDIVGGARGSDGLVDDKTVRVFSEGPRSDANAAMRAAMRRFGGENDSPSRSLSRYIAAIAPSVSRGLRVRQVWRTDRIGRGGDHIPFLDAGIPAIRFSEGVENLNQQHQNLRPGFGDRIEFMNFAYLAKVARLNVAVIGHLASSPPPPLGVVAKWEEASIRNEKNNSEKRQGTELCWHSNRIASAYRVWKRRTDQSQWERRASRDFNVAEVTRHHVIGERFFRSSIDLGNLKGPQTMRQQACVFLVGLRTDDWIFGVSALAADGSESPIASAVPGGAFEPLN